MAGRAQTRGLLSHTVARGAIHGEPELQQLDPRGEDQWAATAKDIRREDDFSLFLMQRPWWLLAFLLPLCCGSTFLMVLLGAGAGGGGLLLGVLVPGPWGALLFGSLAGVAFAIPLIMVADRDLRRRGDACRR